MMKFNDKHEMVEHIAHEISKSSGEEYVNFADAEGTVKNYLHHCGSMYMRYLNFKMSDFDQEVMAKVSNYIDSLATHLTSGHGIYIYGELGTGKTTLASTIAKSLFLKQLSMLGVLSVRFITAMDYVSTHRSANFGDQAARNVIYACEKADLLILDNLGNEFSYTQSANIGSVLMDELIKKRTGNCRPTIITSNLKKDGLVSNYGQVVYDLIRGNSSLIKLENPTLRTLWADEIE